jgi:hypothetical protein
MSGALCYDRHMITPLYVRVMKKFTVGDGCWTWKGSLDKHGYGVFFEKNANTGSKMKGYAAHRLVYEMLVGPIPKGLVIDHLCRNPSCVNPSHLEPVTQGENVRRGNITETSRIRREERLVTVTHCRRGHEYAVEGVFRPDGIRVCRGCWRENMRKYRAKKKGLTT